MNKYVAYGMVQIVKDQVRPLHWRAKSALPIATMALAAAAPGNGRLYALGGISPSGVLNKNFEYDPALDAWTERASMSTARRYLAAAAPGDGKLYAMGGQDTIGNYLSLNEVYDPATNSWAQRMNLPIPVAQFGLASPGDRRLYATGGRTSDGGRSRRNDAYDPSTNTWTNRANMSNFNARHTSVGLNGKVYTFDGDGNPGFTYEYNPVTNTWAARAMMPTARLDAASAPIDSTRAIVVGGYYSGILDKAEEYDSISNAWTLRDNMPTPRYELAAAETMGGSVYVVGGNIAPSTPTATNEEFKIRNVSEVFAPLEGYIIAS